MTSTTSPRFASHPRGLAPLLLLLPACTIGPGIIGDATESDTDPVTSDGTDGTDGTDTDCPTGECDAELAVAALGGVNYYNRPFVLHGTDTCDGPSCPPLVSPTPSPDGLITRCQDTEEAQQAPEGVEEYCRFAAHFAYGLYIGMAGLLDRSSYELVRPNPEDPGQEQPYLWFSDVVRIEGPGTAFRGDYHRGDVEAPDVVTVVHNESCAARLDALGIPWTEDELETLCVGTWDDGGQLRPLRMAPSMTFENPEGLLRSDAGRSCDTPDSGPDTCCSVCDYALGITVAPYGMDPTGARRQVEQGTAIACDPDGDALVQCRDLVLDVERSEQENVYTYPWDGRAAGMEGAWYDKVRETHPDSRPAAVEVIGPARTSVGECEEGQDCIGTNASGQACHEGDDCQQRRCRAPGFGTCTPGPGALGYCRDARFDPSAAASCLRATVDFGGGSAGDRLATCDADGDRSLTPEECCDPALGGGADCDPIGQANLEPVPRFDRNVALDPDAACVCEEGQPDSCAPVIDAWCEAPLGSGSDPGPDSPAGLHALPFVQRVGSPRAEDAEGRLRMRIANLGNLERSRVESCAKARGRASQRATSEGWLANEVYPTELVEDHDLAMCSGSTYRVVFAESHDPHQLRSLGGATLDGRSEHVIETSQFRVVPLSLFPTDDLQIGACDPMHLTFSATYDLGLLNLRKLELRENTADGPLVAGGPGCDEQASPAEVAAGAIPCLDVDVDLHFGGELNVQIDADVHGPVLVPGTTYRLVVPGLESIEQMADPELYAAAFHDACGMPLVVGNTPEQQASAQQSFVVDGPCE